MTIDETVKGEMKDKLSLYERIALYIPGYRGYREKNLRREEDRAVRTEVSRTIQGTKNDLSTIQRLLLGKQDLVLDVERIRTKVDRYDVRVRKAVNGYSGFHDAVKIDESDLDALVKWDARLIDDIQKLRDDTAGLLRTIDEGGEERQQIRDLERTIDAMMEDYENRDTVMRGFADGHEEA